MRALHHRWPSALGDATRQSGCLLPFQESSGQKAPWHSPVTRARAKGPGTKHQQWNFTAFRKHLKVCGRAVPWRSRLSLWFLQPVSEMCPHLAAGGCHHSDLTVPSATQRQKGSTRASLAVPGASERGAEPQPQHWEFLCPRLGGETGALNVCWRRNAMLRLEVSGRAGGLCQPGTVWAQREPRPRQIQQPSLSSRTSVCGG